MTDRAPFEMVDGQVVFHGNDDITQVSLSPGITIGQNIPGSQLMGEDPNMFEMLNQLTQAIRDGETDQIQEFIPQIQQQSENIVGNRARVGIIQNRMESTITNNENQILNLTEGLSRIQDVNIAEKTMELAILETTFMATMQIASQMSRPSLMDFIR